MLAERHHLTFAGAKRIVDSIIDETIHTLVRGDPVHLTGLGSMKMVRYRPRRGYDVNTGEVIERGASWQVRFTVGAQLRRRLSDLEGS